MSISESILNFFDKSSENRVHNVLSKVSLLANKSNKENKLSTIYLYETVAGIFINREFDGLSGAIKLDLDNDECITLCFPSIDWSCEWIQISLLNSCFIQ